MSIKKLKLTLLQKAEIKQAKAQVKAEAKALVKQENQIARTKARKIKKIQIANKLLNVRIEKLSDKITDGITSTISSGK